MRNGINLSKEMKRLSKYSRIPSRYYEDDFEEEEVQDMFHKSNMENPKQCHKNLNLQDKLSKMKECETTYMACAATILFATSIASYALGKSTSKKNTSVFPKLLSVFLKAI
jgi:hypothetical protein